MPSATYSFLDVAVLDAVRGRLASGDAVVVLSTDLAEFIWANGAGAALFGYPDIESIVGADSGLPFAARRQIMSTRGYPHIARDSAIMMRLTQGFGGTSFLATAISLPDGEDALMLVLPAGDTGASQADIAARAIGGFSTPGHAVAMLDRSGAIEAASRDFAALGIAPNTLSDLVAEVSGERDRVVKRIIEAGTSRLPAGIARLSDDPPRHLLVVIDEDQLADEEPVRQQDAPDDETDFADVDADRAGESPVSSEAPEDQASHCERPFIDDRPAAAPLDEAVSYATGGATVGNAQEELAAVGDDQVDPVAKGSDDLAETLPVSATDIAESAHVVEVPTVSSEHAENAIEEVDGTKPNASEPVADTADHPERGEIDRNAAPIRFVWKTDAAGRLSDISPDFVASVGVSASELLGRPFAQISALLQLDPSQEIAGLLERRDTWSGRSVYWPIAGTDRKVPVDLAALPIYSRDRSFEGFRGFGVARLADIVVDPEVAALSLHANPEAPEPQQGEPDGAIAVDDALRNDGDVIHQPKGPFVGEVPALEVRAQHDGRDSDKVIRLAEHRPTPPEKSLSNVERSAFREIGERLKKASNIEDVGRAATTDEPEDKPKLGADETGVAADKPELPFAEPLASDAPDGLSVAVDENASVGNDPADQHGQQISASSASPDAVGASLDETADQPAEDASVTPAAGVHAAIAQLKTGGFLPSAFSPAADTENTIQDTPILARLPVPILIHAGDVLHYANDEFLSLTGYASVEQLATAGGLDALFADPYKDASEDADHSLRLRTVQGDEFAIQALLRSVPWNAGHALMLVVRRTDEMDAQPDAPRPSDHLEVEALRARVAEMRTIIDTATDGVILIGPDHTIRSISRPAEALFGFESDELTGKQFVSLFAMESQRAARDYLNGLSDNGVASVLNDGREVIGREAQGRFIPLFMTIGKLPSDGGFCAVVRDITSWKRAEEELTQARSLAERASSQKSDFLARISHEIRTPLNAIIGFSELMIGERFGVIGNDRYRDYLQDINRSGNHVLELVNDLLDISKIEAGEQEMAHEAVSLNEALAQTVAMMQPQANRERVIIRSSFASRLPDVVADPRSIKQIALNLLSNAVRYTQAGGQVIVSTAYEPSGDVVMRVRDTGIGMTAGEIEQALKPFKQINTLKRPRGDGTGLGLPLTKAMVEANRARFTINSTPGEGTLVEVAFPSTRVLAN
jgi:PAS domain S-box-containing protein